MLDRKLLCKDCLKYKHKPKETPKENPILVLTIMGMGAQKYDRNLIRGWIFFSANSLYPKNANRSAMPASLNPACLSACTVTARSRPRGEKRGKGEGIVRCIVQRGGEDAASTRPHTRPLSRPYTSKSTVHAHDQHA